MGYKLTKKADLLALLERWRTVPANVLNAAEFWREVHEAVERMPDEEPAQNVGGVTNINVTDGIIIDVSVGDTTERKIYVGALGIQQYNEEQCAIESDSLGTDLPRKWSETVLGKES